MALPVPKSAAPSPLDDAPVAAGLFDAALRCLQANRALGELCGSGSAIGRSLTQLMPHLAPELEPLLRRVLAKGESEQTNAGPYGARAWPMRGGGVVLWLESNVEAHLAPSPQSLVAHLPAPAAVLAGPELRYMAANARWTALVGRAELLGRSAWTAHLHLAGQGLWTAVDRARSRRERVESFEVPFRVDRGDEEPVEGFLDLSCEPLAEEGAVLVMALDVSERVNAQRRAEQLAAELERNEGLLRKAALESGALVWIADADGRMRASPSWEGFTGLMASQLASQAWFAAAHPDDRRALERAWTLAVRAGTPFTHQARVRRSDGAWALLALQAAPVRDPDGAVREWLGTAQDVTTRQAHDERAIRLERASVELGDAVELNEVLDALARAAVPSLASAAVLDFVDGNRLVASRVVIGRGDRVVLESREGEPCGGELARLAHASSRTQRATEPPALAGLSNDVPQSALAVPLCSRGRCLAVLTLVDFTRHRFGDDALHAAEALGRRGALALDHALLLRESQASARVRDEFLAGVSHELRTPLTTILAWSRLLRIKGHEPGTLERGLAIIERNAQAQAALVDELIAASRAASGRLQLEPQLLDPASALVSAVAVARPGALARGVELDFRPPDSELAVHADPVRLQQALANLLACAVRGAPSGGKLLASADVDEGAVSLSVADVAPNESRIPPVIGLSLQLAQRIAELHGGALELDGNRRMVMRLPAQLPPALPVAPLPLAVNPRLDGLSVLVVDEDAAERDALASLLSGRGAEVIAAASEREARAELPRGPEAIVSALVDADSGFPELLSGEGPSLLTIGDALVEPSRLVKTLAALGKKPRTERSRGRNKLG